ncbi:hypothetical protein [Heyndrickxia oleronia]|nr:hypothetical protein [Heyndrickxia oleronia]
MPFIFEANTTPTKGKESTGYLSSTPEKKKAGGKTEPLVYLKQNKRIIV